MDLPFQAKKRAPLLHVLFLVIVYLGLWLWGGASIRGYFQFDSTTPQYVMLAFFALVGLALGFLEPIALWANALFFIVNLGFAAMAFMSYQFYIGGEALAAWVAHFGPGQGLLPTGICLALYYISLAYRSHDLRAK